MQATVEFQLWTQGEVRAVIKDPPYFPTRAATIPKTI